MSRIDAPTSLHQSVRLPSHDSRGQLTISQNPGFDKSTLGVKAIMSANVDMYDSVTYFMGRRLHAGDSLLIAPILFHCCRQGTVGC